MKNTNLPISICALVNEIVVGSHDSLNQLFQDSGAPGDPPNLAHHSKWKAWLRRASVDPETDAHSVLGKIIEEFMEVEPLENSNDFNSIFGFSSEFEIYQKNKKRLIDTLNQNGLRYVKGGRIEQLPKGFGIENLAQSLKQKDFHALDVEFERALNNVNNDPASAITASCAILEALFIAYLENHLIDLPSKKTIKPLWVKVQNHLGFNPKLQSDQDIKKILSGMTSIVDGIGAFRTHSGSAHGGGKLRYNVQSRHAKLAVSSSHTLSLFVIETWEERYKNRQ